MTVEEATEFYFANEAREMRIMVDKILKKFGNFPDPDNFYSLADEVFVKEIIGKYDESKGDLQKFIKFTLERKIKTELTRQNRIKRKAQREAIPIDTPIGDSDFTLEAIIKDENMDVHKEAFGELSSKADTYLSKLSKKQRAIVDLLLKDYEKSAILKELHMTNGDYNRHMSTIRATENVMILY